MNKEEICRLSQLGLLGLGPDEAERFAREMEELLVLIEQVRTAAPLWEEEEGASLLALRADDVGPSMDRAALLEPAGAADREAFTVPRMV